MGISHATPLKVRLYALLGRVSVPQACFVCAGLPRCPFRRRRSGQERTPIVLLFLHHDTSYLGVQMRRIFLVLAHERCEGTIEIHRPEGEQSQEGFLFDHQENLRHPRIRAKLGLGQNEIHLSGVAISYLTPETAMDADLVHWTLPLLVHGAYVPPL